MNTFSTTLTSDRPYLNLISGNDLYTFDPCKISLEQYAKEKEDDEDDNSSTAVVTENPSNIANMHDFDREGNVVEPPPVDTVTFYRRR